MNNDTSVQGQIHCRQAGNLEASRAEEGVVIEFLADPN